ncbi:MAG: hypothetical protein E8A46_02610 [Bradyrhizobium sp.]|uniref:hypothetical protein n=1 Tax=Bradyrhizobium sp. TaxID=376 RepID=UPI001223FD10|nr:hypothetical protein [Bradyrhizobium sp.]THD56754.1 MAG: hypothetical protein E8A46_02610 [Bradyrhizobium sp.]
MDANALDAVEEIAEQTSIRVNERHHRGKFGWAISPNIERAAAHCEKRKAPPPDRPPAARPAAPRQKSPRAQLAPVPIRSMAELLAALRARRDELHLTHETIDAIAGWPAGYAGKLLAPEPIKNLGWSSLGLALNTFGIALVVVEDEEQKRRVEKRWTPRERPQRPPASAKSPNSGLSASAPQPASPPLLTVVAAKRRGSKYG